MPGMGDNREDIGALKVPTPTEAKAVAARVAEQWANCGPTREKLAREVAADIAQVLHAKAHEFTRLAESLGEQPYPAEAALRRSLSRTLRLAHEL